MKNLIKEHENRAKYFEKQENTCYTQGRAERKQAEELSNIFTDLEAAKAEEDADKESVYYMEAVALAVSEEFAEDMEGAFRRSFIKHGNDF